MTVATKRPRRPKDISNFLASINRRVARATPWPKTISEGCVTSYIPPKGQPAQSQFHGEGGSAAKPRTTLTIPTLLFGIDTTEIQRTMLRRVETLTGSANDPGVGLDEEQTRAAKESVIPRNRLRSGPVAAQLNLC
jgi:hypothetical protein